MEQAARASRFIGRAAELARLDAALDQAIDGQGGTLIVGGEAGIGKTRVLERFAASAVDRGARVLAGACLEFGGRGVPFVPLVEAFRVLARSVEPARMPALLGPSRRGLARLLPEFGDGPLRVADSPEIDRYAQARLFEAILGVIEHLNGSTPVALIVEDIQWADEDTRDLLAFLVRHLRRTHILMALTVRTDDLDRRGPTARFLGEVERDDGVERLELRPLGRDELGELLSDRHGGSLPADLLDELLARSAGNPFYAEQLLAAAPGGGTDLPPELQDVLLARLADLSPGAGDVVRAAAAAGPQFDEDLLGCVVTAPNVEVERSLREAIEAGILVAAPVSADRPGYLFRHALLRDAVYGQLLAGERVRLHASFARRLMERREAGDEVRAGELAYHLDAARDFGRALPVLVQAGLESEHAYSFGVARRLFERALEVWDRAVPAAGLASVDRASVMHRAAECSEMLGEHARAIELGRGAIALLGRADRPDPVRLGVLHDRLRWYLWEAGDVLAAEAAVGEALRLTPAQPPSAARARVMGQAAGVRMTAGDLGLAADLASRALEMSTAVGAQPEEAFARGVLGWCEAVSGEIDRGIATFGDGLAMAERLGRPEGIALGHANLAALLDRVGRTEASLAAALDGYAVVNRLGVRRTYGGMLLGHATKALLDLGRWREAAELADKGLDLDPIGTSAVWLHINQARLDTNRGRFWEASSHLDRAHQLGASAGPANPYAVALLAAQAELARWQGRLDAVRDAVEDGIRSIREDGPLDPALGWLAATGLRAEADVAVVAGARHDAAALTVGLERADRIIELANRLSHAPATAADGRREAMLALCRAEVRRVRGESRPSDWEAVAGGWERLLRPYPAAYGWYRAAEAVLATHGSRTASATMLRNAHRIVADLGAGPLQEDIERLARHARISLDPGLADDPATVGRLGLTERESEVLRLVAAGWSNQRIADALFITKKTASVHVSNILGKLGVANRVEAAVVAHRIGLIGAVGSQRIDA